MSIIDKKPLINQILKTLNKNELVKLRGLINGDVNSPVFSSLLINSSNPLTYDAENTVREATIEVDRNKGQTIYNGYLIYNALWCVLISYANMQTQQLQLIKMEKDANDVWAYYVMPCNVSVADLRSELNDLLIEAGGSDDHVVNSIEVDDIKNMTNEELDDLQPGDIVNKKTGNAVHSYRVSYKGTGAGTGICLTYTDASIVETVSYDRSGSGWVYNSTDIVPVAGGGMENPMTTKGDIIIGDTDGEPNRLAAGTEKQVLKMGGQLPEWGGVDSDMIDAGASTLGQVLTSGGNGKASWQTPAAGGGANISTASGFDTDPAYQYKSNYYSLSVDCYTGTGGSNFSYLILGEYNGNYGWHHIYGSDAGSYLTLTKVAMFVIDSINIDPVDGDYILDTLTITGNDKCMFADGTAVSATYNNSTVNNIIGKLIYIVNGNVDIRITIKPY